MHDDIKQVEGEMRNFGIDVTSAKRKGLLYIYKILDPREHPKGFMEGTKRYLIYDYQWLE